MSNSLQRVKAVISYDGSTYFGFQKQTSTTKTITYEIENALASLQISSPIIGSGRTDAGVHASGQIIHFDIPSYWNDTLKLKIHLNRKLHNIQFKHISKVSSTFHARFSAKKRIYRYVFKTKKPSIFEQKYISYYHSFNHTLLNEALQYFEGKHDFDFFRKTGTDTHTSIRETYSARYIKKGNYHFIYFQANSFLRSQVRMMVEAAMLCAQNKLTMVALQEQINCQLRHTTKLAPPEGLYLAKIIY